MNKDEIMETLQLNKKDKKNGIVLIFIASLLAFVTAIYGAFRFGKNKGTAQASAAKKVRGGKVSKSDAKSDVRAQKQHRKAAVSMRRRTRSVSDRQADAQDAPATVVYKYVAPQPVYVVNPLQEKKRESRGKRFTRHMCAAAAAILLITMVGSTAMQSVEPATALAKESFSGIGQIVKDHDDDDPYKILDIVPLDAEYYAVTEGTDGKTYEGIYNFSLGSMGYLVSGEAPIVEDLKEAFSENVVFSRFEERKSLVNDLIVSGSKPGVTYAEAYPGVDAISESAGWIQIFGQTEVPDDEDGTDDGSTGGSGDTDGDTGGSGSTDSAVYATGQFRGTAEYNPDGGRGYDYTPLEGEGLEFNKRNLLSPDMIYEYKGMDGHFRLQFEFDRIYDSEDITGGYVANELGDLSNGSYPYTTCVYMEISPGIYRYVTTVGELIGDGSYDFGSASSSSGSTNTSSGSTTTGDGETQGGDSGNTNTGGNTTGGDNTGGDTTGGDNTNQGGDDTNQGGDDTNQGGDDTNQGGDNTNQGGDDTNQGGDGNNQGGDANQGGDSTGGDTTGGNSTGGDTTGGDSTTISTDLTVSSLSVDKISVPAAKAVVLPDGWRLLVEDYETGGDDSNTGGGDSNTGGDGTNTDGDNSNTGGSDSNTGGDGTNTDGGSTGGDNTGGSTDGGYTGEENSGGDYTGGQDTSRDPVIEPNWEDFAGYKIVYFEYKDIDELWDGAILYKVNENETEWIPDGVPTPFDTYDPDYSTSTLASNVMLMATSPDDTDDSEKVDAVFAYTPGQGTYKLTRTGAGTDRLIEIKGAPVYFRCTTNNDWIKEFVFCTLAGGDNKNDDFQIEVITKRADEVTAAMVKDADLIFLESGYNNVALHTGIAAMTIHSIGDTYDDMSDSAAAQILRSAVEDLKPVIVDYDIVESEDHYKDSNYQYLAKAFLKDDLEEFVNKMDKDGNLMGNLKTNANIEDSDEFPNTNDNGNNYVNRNVYIVNDDTPLVSEDFPDEFSRDKSRAGFSEVLNAIKAENTTLSDDDHISEQVSKARAVQYIINYSVGIVGEFEDLRILEIQPSANLKSDLYREDNKKLGWKTESMTTAKPILSSKKEFNVDIDVKSVVEFNGEWEDVNGNYDMIFIGLDGQRLNQENGKTVYNNPALNGKVYHSGDNSDSGRGPYDANDLTAQKMEELLEFMEAGYPIVVENNCFVKGSAQDSGSDGINYAYIQEGTAMDHFLQTAVSNPKYEDYIFSVSDVTSPMFMTQIRIAKPRISLVDENNEETSKVQALTPDDDGEYHGKVYYKIESSKGGEYVGNPVVKVYADYNYDGYFIPSEEVTEFVSDGNMMDVRIDGMGPGILPFKIEVSDSGNRFRRDSVQGYFRLTSTVGDEMKVLQITEKKGENNWQVDLQQMFDRVENSTLAYYLHGVETSFDMEMQFESVTASQLETKLAANAQYLEQYDVVVLTLDNAAGSSAVAGAVSQYVENGRSLLVCGQDPGDQRAGLDSALLGQADGRTFVNIGTGGKYLRYADLKGDMFDGKTNLKVEPVNEGSISCFPYVIDGSFTLGDTGALKAAPYQLNLDNNMKSESEKNSFVTAWYTFGSNDSKDSAYGISPRDARNNYYCYSKGNVVYLAQSEYGYICDALLGPSPNDVGVSECQFFVNALFAAYSAGLHNAHINIVSGFSPDAADIESISVPFDEAWLEAADDTTGGILDNTVDVFFKFRDNNIAAEKTTLVGFYREAAEGEDGDTFIINGEPVVGVEFGSEVWTVTDNKLVQVEAGGELQPGKIYRIEAPVVTLRSLRNNDTQNKADIYIVLKTTFKRNGRDYEIITTDAVSLNRARLFRLE